MAVIAAREESNGQRLELSVGDSIALELPENGTTGYRWSIVAGAEPICERARELSEAVNASRPGAPGVLRCEFRVVKPGTASIKLDSKRAWSGDVARSFTLEISAR